MDLVDEEMRAAIEFKPVCQVYQSVVAEIDVVGTDIKVLSVALLLYDTLQKHRRFADTSGTDYAHHAVMPWYIPV